MFKTLVSILFATSVGSSALASTIYQCKQNSDGQYVIELSNISRHNAGSVLFRNKNTGKTKEVQLQNQDKLTYQASKKIIHWDHPDSDHYVLEVIIPMLGGRSAFHRECNYRPVHQPITYHSLPSHKIINYADQQARTVANNIIASFGNQEKYKANFVRGLNAGYGRNWNSWLDIALDLVDSSFTNGHQAGVQKAQSEGYEVGYQAAKEDARTSADQEVYRRHKQAAVNSVPVSQAMAVPFHAFSSSRLSSKVIDVSTELRNKIDAYQTELIPVLKRVHYNFDGLSYTFQLESDFSLYNWLTLNGSYSFFESYFAGGNALDEWKQNRLMGRYDHKLYNKMSFFEQQQFERKFIEVYSQVINTKLANKIAEYDATMYELGVSYGRKIYREEAYLRGLEQGFKETISLVAQRIYNDTFPSAYVNRFNNQMDYYQNNPVLEFSALLSDHQGTPGLVTIQGQVLNIGAQAAFGKEVHLRSDHFISETPYYIDNIPGHGGASFKFQTELTLKKPITADTDYNTKITMGLHSVDAKVSFSFKDLAKLWCDCSFSSVKESLRTSMIKTITNEWYQNCGVFQTDIYNASLNGDPSSSYLGQLVTMKQDGYTEVTSLYSDLATCGRWMARLHFNKNASYHKLLNHLK